MVSSIELVEALLDARKIMIARSIRKRKRSPTHCNSSTISPQTTMPPNTSSVAFSTVTTEDDEFIADTLIFLSEGPSSPAMEVQRSPEKVTSRRVMIRKEGPVVYECKTCNKSFSSFQALGGHRASHKKPKLTLGIEKAPHEIASTSGVIKSEEVNNTSEVQGDEFVVKKEQIIPSNGNGCKNKARIHKCLICVAEFYSGQALGGHMRRHRPLMHMGNRIVRSNMKVSFETD